MKSLLVLCLPCVLIGCAISIGSGTNANVKTNTTTDDTIRVQEVGLPAKTASSPLQ